MEPGLLSVNRQIRSESMGIFYSNNSFSFSDPQACIHRLTSIPLGYIDLIQDLRFDTSEICASGTSWTAAFPQNPATDQGLKMEKLKEELSKCGVELSAGVLKCRVLLGSGSVWTDDPIRTALTAAKHGQCKDESRCADCWLLM